MKIENILDTSQNYSKHLTIEYKKGHKVLLTLWP